MKKKGSNLKAKITPPLTDDEIDKIFLDITLKNPPNCYNLYIQDKYAEVNLNKADKDKMSMIEVNKKFHSDWPDKIDQKKMDEYKETYERLKTKFDYEVEVVKKVLIDQFYSKGASAKKLFYNEQEKQAIIKGESVEETLKLAEEEWKNMSPAQKEIWEEKKKQNDKFWEIAEEGKKGKMNGYAFFVKDKLQELKDDGKDATLEEAGNAWKELSIEEKKEYEKEAENFNQMKEKFELFQQVNQGLTPDRPKGKIIIFNYSRRFKLILI